MSLGASPLVGVRFDWRATLRAAGQVLSAEPVPSRVQRPERQGTLVQRFALPLDLCLPTNRTRHSNPGQHAKTKRAILNLLQVQARAFVRREPLPGRPQVLCLRVSSREPDKYADWAKMVVDALCVPKGRRKDGMGYLRDDSPKHADVHQWWEQGRPGAGFVYVEVRTER